MKIFAEEDLFDFTNRRLQQAENEVRIQYSGNLTESEFNDYKDRMYNAFRLEPIEWDWDRTRATHAERQISSEYFPRDFAMRHNRERRSFPKQVVTFHIPFTGNPQLLRCKPSRWQVWTYECSVSNSSVSFEIVDFYEDAAKIKNESDDIINSLKIQTENINKDINGFNSQLSIKIDEILASKYKTITKLRDGLKSLGIKFQWEDPPDTFKVPIIERKITPKAVISNQSNQKIKTEPEFCISDEDYIKILQIIYDLGISLERHPSVYRKKEEEDLRDLFILLLSPHFHTATGETFNSSGKTDILIRHEKSNVFVAECKIWKGQSKFPSAIDQLLSYLVWRDSTAAIINFIHNEDLLPVLKKVEETCKAHPLYISSKPKTKQSWLNYEFRLKEDSETKIKLAVLSFHLK